MKSQMKAADRAGATLALIVGEDEAASDTVLVRDMRHDSPQSLVHQTAVVEYIRQVLTPQSDV